MVRNIDFPCTDLGSRVDLCPDSSFNSGGAGTSDTSADYRTATSRPERTDVRRQRVDADFGGAGSADDGAGFRALLWRSGAQAEHSLDHDAEFRQDGPGEHSVGDCGLLAGLRPRKHVYRRV